MITMGFRKILIVCVYVGAAAASGLYSVLRPAGRPRTALYSCTVAAQYRGQVQALCHSEILRPSQAERGWGLDQLTRVRLLYTLYTACTVQYKDLHYHLSCQTD